MSQIFDKKYDFSDLFLLTEVASEEDLVVVLAAIIALDRRRGLTDSLIDLSHSKLVFLAENEDEIIRVQCASGKEGRAATVLPNSF